MSILISGITGKLGENIINILDQRKDFDRKKLVLMVRDETKAKYYKEQGYQVRIGDYSDYGSLVSSLKGIERVLFISGNDFKNRLQQNKNLLAAAEENSVKHVIYTSFTRKTEDGSSPVFQVEKDHITTEHLLKEGVYKIPNYTILVNALYSEVYTEWLLGPKILDQGSIYLPCGEGKSNLVTRKDLAEVALNVLLDENGTHNNKSYQLTNPTSYSFQDVSKYLSEFAGKEIPYHNIDLVSYKQTLSKFGVKDYLIDLLSSFTEAIKVGELESLPNQSDLILLLGKNPQTLRDHIFEVYNKK